MQNLKNKLNHLSHRQIVIIGVVSACIGLFLLSYNYIDSKISYAYDVMNIKMLKKEQPEISNENNMEGSPDSVTENHTVIDAPTKEEQVQNDKISANYYIGTLEIPRIGFKRGFLDKNSKLNNVNKNIAVMSASNYPDQPNGNLIIAGHSGNSSVAFFGKLYELEQGDLAYVTYKNKKYTYQIKNIYLQPKGGTVAIYRDKSKRTLTLITCTQNDSQNQTIYIAEIIKEEKV